MASNRLRNALIAAVAIAILLPGALLGRQSAQPFVGVTYSVRTVKAPRPLTMHVAQVDLEAPGIHFKVSAPAGDREVVRQSTLDFLKQEHAQLAINAHYFLPFPSEDRTAWVIGLAASEGRLFSAFESPEQSFALVANAPAINLDPQNHATLIHNNPAIASPPSSTSRPTTRQAASSRPAWRCSLSAGSGRPLPAARRDSADRPSPG